MRISDWSSDVCSSDLVNMNAHIQRAVLTISADKTTAHRSKSPAQSFCDWWFTVSKCHLNKEKSKKIARKIEETWGNLGRSEERREGKEGVGTCRSRWAP